MRPKDEATEAVPVPDGRNVGRWDAQAEATPRRRSGWAGPELQQSGWLMSDKHLYFQKTNK